MENEDAKEVQDSSAGTQEIDDKENDSTPSLELIEDDDGLVSTMEFNSVEEKDKEADDESAKEAETLAAKEAEVLETKERYDEIPRFQELKSKRDEYKTALTTKEAENQALTEKLQGFEKQQAPAKPDYENIMGLDNEVILDRFGDDAKGLFSDVAKQIHHEISMALEAKQNQASQAATAQAQKTQINQTYREFFADKPYEKDMPGKIDTYMSEHPGHNAISAYQAITEKTRTQEAVAKAVKEDRKKYESELKAAGHVRSVSSSSGAPKTQSAYTDELKNPNKYGGVKNVLLKNFYRREKSAG